MPDLKTTWEGLDADETREIVALKNSLSGNPHRNRHYCELFDKHDRAVTLRARGSEQVPSVGSVAALPRRAGLSLRLGLDKRTSGHGWGNTGHFADTVRIQVQRKPIIASVFSRSC
jgi:hypothetical protein